MSNKTLVDLDQWLAAQIHNSGAKFFKKTEKGFKAARRQPEIRGFLHFGLRKTDIGWAFRE